MWLMPWSATKERHNDYDDLLYMGRKAIESLRKTHGTNYNLVSKQTNSYPISGQFHEVNDKWPSTSTYAAKVEHLKENRYNYPS